MRNIQPWCISRQLWWGHRIPAWFGPGGKIFVAETEEEAKHQARELYGRDEPLRQDEDVLDTWFSSALWPFSTLGWPEKTSDLARFYPTHTLVTGFDIIFFWVARMMMQGIHFMDGQVPFKRIFINALVRDAEGKKMSKSKGNVMDPLELVDDYGADALRFTLTAMSGQARDIKLSRERIEGYRNFGTKLWNATRFTQMNGAAARRGLRPCEGQAADQPLDRRRDHPHRPGRHRRSRHLRLRRRCRRPLPLRLAPVLRLVCGTVEAGPRKTGRTLRRRAGPR